MRLALESHNDITGFGFWIPAFAGMTGVNGNDGGQTAHVR